MIQVYLEVERSWAFACAIDHPGWQRRGKGEAAALEELEAYRGRYGAAVGVAPVGELQVVATVAGTTTTGFGAPDVRGPWDDEPVTPGELAAVAACWETFDLIVAGTSAELAKGPRGGGRDRDEVVAHVVEAERAYGRKVGVRVPPRTPWADQRDAVLERLTGGGAWPAKYAARRIAWHVLDHAWELEDKSLR